MTGMQEINQAKSPEEHCAPSKSKTLQARLVRQRHQGLKSLGGLLFGDSDRLSQGHCDLRFRQWFWHICAHSGRNERNVKHFVQIWLNRNSTSPNLVPNVKRELSFRVGCLCEMAVLVLAVLWGWTISPK